MTFIFLIIQIVLALLLILFVLIQTRGTGLGRSWGQATSFTRRGFEKYLFRATFVVSALFLVTAVLSLTL